MCKLCETNPVYEFTNQRKLCQKCFIDYFQKKFLYTIRKFQMIKPGEKVGYVDNKKKDFKEAVLLEMLLFLSKKSNIQLVELKSSNKKTDKIAVSSSIDTESKLVIKEIINGDSSKLKEYLPLKKKVIKPLYSFLDEEILLFANLKGLKYSETKQETDKLNDFINGFEKDHPEVKRAIINSLLKLYPN